MPRRKENARVTRELKNIYAETDGKMPDFSVFEHPKRSWRSKAIGVAAVFLILAGATWGGFFFFGGFQPIRNEGLALEIEAPAMISGLPEKIIVLYENQGRIPIASLSLRVNLPTNFILARTVPEATGVGGTWELGSLASLSDGRVEIYGTLIAEAPSTQKVQAVASYRPANFNSEFDVIVAKDLAVTESAVALDLSVPPSAATGEAVTMTYTLANATVAGIDGVRLHPTLPAGFTVTHSEPPLTDGGVWDIERMEPHSKATFSLTGVGSANSRGVFDAGGEMFFSLPDGSRIRQIAKTSPIEFTGGALTGSVIVNGSGRDQHIKISEPLRISLPFANGTKKEMTDLAVMLSFTSNKDVPVDWQSEETNLAGAKREGKTLTWTANEMQTLASLSGDGGGVIDLALPLFPDLDPATESETFTLTATFSAVVPSQKERLTVSTTPLTITLDIPQAED